MEVLAFWFGLCIPSFVLAYMLVLSRNINKGRPNVGNQPE